MKGLKKLLPIGVAVALLVSLLAPAAVFAANVTGNVTASNNAPESLSLTLKVHGGAATDAMTPLTEYDLEIDVTDDNTLADIAQIDIVIFFDEGAGDNGVPGGAWDCDEEAIYKWVSTGNGTWSMEDGDLTPVTNHTWTLEGAEGHSDQPGTMTATSTSAGNKWILAFKPGKLAAECDGDPDEWDIYVKVSDASGNVPTTTYSLSMTAYSSIATDVSSITFGSGVALGATAYIAIPTDYNFATRVLANDAHDIKVASADTWTGDPTGTLTLDTSGTPDAAGEFALNIDDAGTASSLTAPQPVTDSAVTISGYGSLTTSRVTTADGVAEATSDQNLYMSLKLFSSGIPVGAYSGTITLTIVNS